MYILCGIYCEHLGNTWCMCQYLPHNIHRCIYCVMYILCTSWEHEMYVSICTTQYIDVCIVWCIYCVVYIVCLYISCSRIESDFNNGHKSDILSTTWNSSFIHRNKIDIMHNIQTCAKLYMCKDFFCPFAHATSQKCRQANVGARFHARMRSMIGTKTCRKFRQS